MIPTLLAGVAGLLAAPALGALAYRAVRQRRIARALEIRAPNGIVEDRFVQIGGIDQWIGIRGEDRDNPVLLVLHGGPGSPYSMFTPILRPWERHFTVVQWDRRGVGKTLGRNGKAGSGEMTFGRMVDDGIEVAELLRAHLGQDRVVLLASSMGTVVGVPMVQRRPDLFSAYVGTDQNVNMARSEALSYEVTLDRLRAAGNTEGIAALEAIGADPLRWDVRGWTAKQRWVMRTDPMVRDLDRRLLLPLILSSPTYTLRDIAHVVAGLEFAAARLFDESMTHDARRLGTRFEVPFFLFQGEADVYTMTSLAEEYFAEVEAPHKAFALIRNAGHFAAFTRPDQFLTELLTHVRPLVTAAAAPGQRCARADNPL
ncbi:alpha/beta fold hydrolase [Sorangium sp. So ce118]